jgi:tetratricopeptide (TPR) repeat protein
VLWFLAAGLSLCMRRNIDETPTLFATLSWSLATLVAITILAALGSFLIGTDQAVFGAVLFFGSLAFALIVAVKTVRTVLALRKQRGSPLVGAIIASIFAFAVVFFAGAAGALMSGLVYSQRVLVREIYSAEAEGRRTEAMYRAADFVQARDFDSAIVEFSKAIEADPDYARGYADRAGAFTQKRDFAAALNDMDEAIRLDGENPAYLGGRCMLKVSMAEALPAADAPAEQKPGDQAAEPDQKQALVQSAQGDCSRALELAPGSVEVLDQRARIHLSLREFEAALADYEAVLKTQPDNLPALYGRGLALRGLGKTKDGDRDMAAAAARDAAVAAPFKTLGFDPPSAGAPAP